MKKILLFFVVVFIATPWSANRVMAQSTITILEYKDATVTNYTSPTTGTIAQGAVKDPGLILNIDKGTKVVAIGIKSMTGTYAMTDPTETTQQSVRFLLKDPFVDADHKISVRLYKDKAHPETSQTLTLVVDPAGGGTGGTDLISRVIAAQCTLTLKDNTKKCNVYGIDNFFGENAADYDEGKIVYVYDFNHEGRTKVFYKLTRIKNPAKSKKIKAEKEAHETAQKKARAEAGNNPFTPTKFTLSDETNNLPDYALKVEVADFDRERLSPGKHMQFKIVNINRFMYDVSATRNFVSYDSQPSALFNQFFLGDSNLLGSLMSTYSSGLATAKSKLEGGNGTDENLVQLLIEIRCFMEKYNGLNGKMIDAYNPCAPFNCCENFDYESFANALLHIRLRVALVQGQLNDAKDALAKATTALDACNKAKADLDAANKAKKDLGDKPDAAKLKTANDQIDALTKLLCKDDAAAALAATKDSQTALVKSYTSISDLLTKLPTDNDIKKIALFINNMVYANTIQVIEEPQIRGDRLDMAVYFKSRDSLLKYTQLSPVNDSVKFSIQVLRRPMITFSSGSFMEVGGRLKNKTYDYQPVANNKLVSDTSKLMLAESGYSAPVVGFSALGNVEWRLSPTLGIGGSAGVGLTIEKSPRPSYLAGLSFFVGNERQFVLTGGFTGMQVDVLNNNLQAAYAQGLQYTASSKQAISYYKVMRSSMFISITFTPFTFSKK